MEVVGAGGRDEYGRVLVATAQVEQDVVAVDARQRGFDERDDRVTVSADLSRRLAIADRDHLVLFITNARSELLRERGVRVGDQHDRRPEGHDFGERDRRELR